MGAKADGGQERLRWVGGVAHILQSYVPEVPLPALLYVGTIPFFFGILVGVFSVDCTKSSPFLLQCENAC